MVSTLHIALFAAVPVPAAGDDLGPFRGSSQAATQPWAHFARTESLVEAAHSVAQDLRHGYCAALSEHTATQPAMRNVSSTS